MNQALLGLKCERWEFNLLSTAVKGQRIPCQQSQGSSLKTTLSWRVTVFFLHTVFYWWGTSFIVGPVKLSAVPFSVSTLDFIRKPVICNFQQHNFNCISQCFWTLTTVPFRCCIPAASFARKSEIWECRTLIPPSETHSTPAHSRMHQRNGTEVTPATPWCFQLFFQQTGRTQTRWWPMWCQIQSLKVFLKYKALGGQNQPDLIQMICIWRNCDCCPSPHLGWTPSCCPTVIGWSSGENTQS